MIRPFVWPDGEILRSTVELQVEMSAEGKNHVREKLSVKDVVRA